MNIDVMITVRSQSTRLPEKCFLPFGEGNVIEHIIRRAKYFGFNPIVCTTIEEEDDRIAEISKNENIRCFRGSVKDKLLRWRNACRKFEIKKFVSVDADDPFFDKELTILSFNMLCEKYDFVDHPEEQPYEGCVGYALTTSIIERACAIKESDDTEMMWFYLEKVADLKKAVIPVSINKKAGHIRLTLDYQEDYWLLCTILRILGPYAEKKEIENLFESNPDLYEVNWFRNEEYKSLHEEKRV